MHQAKISSNENLFHSFSLHERIYTRIFHIVFRHEDQIFFYSRSQTRRIRYRRYLLCAHRGSSPDPRIAMRACKHFAGKARKLHGRASEISRLFIFVQTHLPTPIAFQPREFRTRHFRPDKTRLCRNSASFETRSSLQQILLSRDFHPNILISLRWSLYSFSRLLIFFLFLEIYFWILVWSRRSIVGYFLLLKIYNWIVIDVWTRMYSIKNHEWWFFLILYSCLWSSLWKWRILQGIIVHMIVAKYFPESVHF